MKVTVKSTLYSIAEDFNLLSKSINI
jgi:hypothetical protein